MAIAGIAVQLMKTIRNKYLYHLGFSVTGLLGFWDFISVLKQKWKIWNILQEWEWMEK
jgi:hypothetical protein